jgi:hypothetical protein
MYHDLESLIMNSITVLAFWAGISIILGFRRIGGFLAFLHSILKVLFIDNMWTPQTDKDYATNFLIVLAEIWASAIVLMNLSPNLKFFKAK